MALGELKGSACAYPKGVGGGAGGPDPPPGKSQKYSKTGVSLLNGVSLACRWWPAYSGIWILSPLNNQQKKKKRNWRFAGGPIGPLIVIFESSLLSTTKTETLSKVDPSVKTLWIRALSVPMRCIKRQSKIHFFFLSLLHILRERERERERESISIYHMSTSVCVSLRLSVCHLQRCDNLFFIVVP